MKHRLVSSVRLAVLAGDSSLTPAMAAVSIDWVTVGNAGNAADTADGDQGTGGVQRYGAVGYEYRIARNETTIGQYAEFLNAVAKDDTYGLYSTNMTASAINGISQSGSPGSYSYTVNPGSANKPITYVSWFDAARFCNWLHNGQPSGTQTVGTTETGAYDLNGAINGVHVSKNVGATVWIPAEDEWYKAAYYDPTKSGGAGGYWLYPTQSDALAGNTVGVANSANYHDGDYATYTGGTSWGITDVGAYGANSDSYYGTNDQGGNMSEWIDAVIGGYHGLRGGSWGSNLGEFLLRSSTRDVYYPGDENYFIGFRVASVPESSAMVLTMMFSAGLVCRRRR